MATQAERVYESDLITGVWIAEPKVHGDERGLLASRADMTGDATPQSAPTAGSSHATPNSSDGL